jgi:hypothetical protein
MFQGQVYITHEDEKLLGDFKWKGGGLSMDRQVARYASKPLLPANIGENCPFSVVQQALGIRAHPRAGVFPVSVKAQQQCQ